MRTKEPQLGTPWGLSKQLEKGDRTRSSHCCYKNFHHMQYKKARRIVRWLFTPADTVLLSEKTISPSWHKRWRIDGWNRIEAKGRNEFALGRSGSVTCQGLNKRGMTLQVDWRRILIERVQENETHFSSIHHIGQARGTLVINIELYCTVAFIFSLFFFSISKTLA